WKRSRGRSWPDWQREGNRQSTGFHRVGPKCTDCSIRTDPIRTSPGVKVIERRTGESRGRTSARVCPMTMVGGLAFGLLLFGSGCAVGPRYSKPAATVPPAYKED